MRVMVIGKFIRYYILITILFILIKLVMFENELFSQIGDKLAYVLRNLKLFFLKKTKNPNLN